MIRLCSASSVSILAPEASNVVVTVEYFPCLYYFYFLNSGICLTGGKKNH